MTGIRFTAPLVALLTLAPHAAAAQPAEAGASAEAELARAEELLDSERAAEAIELLDRLLERSPRLARGYLLRSSAHFVEGERRAGRRDLERALELDPALRQAWLNRAALDLSEGDTERALEALIRARELDPQADDNDLNLGAVRLIRGELQEAAGRFEDYLAKRGGSADAHFLVASNYAMAGFAGPAVDHLRRAVALDEKSRLRARTDPNFASLAQRRDFQILLERDDYLPPEGAHRAVRHFDIPYQGGRGPLLVAVMNALQLAGRPFDPRVEVTPAWSLLWSDVRIKIAAVSDTASEIRLSAPAERFTPGEWQRLSEDLFRDVALELVKLAKAGR